MIEFLTDSANWFFISFVVFAFGAWKLGKAGFTNMLDARIDIIRKEIETAESLRVEAQELLAQYQRKYRDSLSDAQLILDKAEQGAAEVKEQALADLQAQLKRHESLHEERLNLMKQDAIRDIQEYAAKLAVDGTRQIIIDKLGKADQKSLLDTSIKNIDKSMN